MIESLFYCIGLSHKTAPIRLRELFAYNEDEAVDFLRTLQSLGIIDEAVLLSTCNRTEVYAVRNMASDKETFVVKVISLIASKKGQSEKELTRNIYSIAGLDAILHLLRVASSLDSLVVGEPQIFGQVRAAHRIAVQAGTVHGLLSRIFERVFKVAKDVRTKTGVGVGEVSVGSVAVDIASKVFSDLKTCSVLLLGAGKMGEAVAKTLKSGGATRVVVANRTLQKAEEVAQTYGWEASSLETLDSLLLSSDVVIASISHRGYICTRHNLKKTMALRRFRPLFIIDISLPRVIEPSCATLEGVYLYNIDHLNDIVQEHLQRRHISADVAEGMVEEELKTFEGFLRVAEIEPVISRVMHSVEEIKTQELQKAKKALMGRAKSPDEVLDAFASSIIAKVLAKPLSTLRSEAKKGNSDVLEAFKMVFGLENGVKDEEDKACDEREQTCPETDRDV
jgi:glutamyl-tRNA reductase